MSAIQRVRNHHTHPGQNAHDHQQTAGLEMGCLRHHGVDLAEFLRFRHQALARHLLQFGDPVGIAGHTEGQITQRGHQHNQRRCQLGQKGPKGGDNRHPVYIRCIPPY